MDADNFVSKYANLYKGKGFKKRDSSRSTVENDRRDKRRATVNARRNIDSENEITENIPPTQLNKAESRKLKLEQWKKQKEELLKTDKSTKKPFVVGVYHHRVNSPIFPPAIVKKRSALKPIAGPSQNLKRQTRADTKKKTEIQKPESTQANNVNFPFKNKIKPSAVFKFKATHLSSTKKLTHPESPLFMKREAAKKKVLTNLMATSSKVKKQSGKQSSSDEELATPLSPPVRVTRNQVLNKQSVRVMKGDEGHPQSNEEESLEQHCHKSEPKPDEPITNEDITITSGHIPDSSANDPATKIGSSIASETIQNSTSFSPNSNEDNAIMPEHKIDSSPDNFTISPFVTVERGKKYSRRSGSLRARQRISLRDCPTEDEPEDGPTFQKNRLNNESRRLLQLAENWEKLARLENLSQAIVDEVDSIVGLTRLLTRDKFQQFRNLIEQHEADGDVKVTIEDLNGFWDMMYLQVENLNKKYNHLDILKSNNWLQPEPVISVKPKKRTSKKIAINAKSSVLDFIRAKKAKNVNSEENKDVECVSTPKRLSSVAQDSPSALNALKQSFIAKEFGKSPMITVTQTVVQTPKSCLKPKTTSFIHSSARKTVLFNETIDVQQVEESNNSSSTNTEGCSSSSSANYLTVQNDTEVQMFTPRRSARLSMKASSSQSKNTKATPQSASRKSSRLSLKKECTVITSCPGC